MENIQFSYTRKERSRCILQPGPSGPSMASFLVPAIIVYWLFDGVSTVAKFSFEGLEFINWFYALLLTGIVASLVHEGYKATEKYLGVRTLNFGDANITIAVDGLIVSMTKLKGFALISPAYFLLQCTDGSNTLIPTRIFDSPGQVERFKRCGNDLVENYKRLYATPKKEVGVTIK